MRKSKVFFVWVLFVSGGLVALGARPAGGQEGTGGSFIRGDADADGGRNITDAVYMLGCNFLGSECAACADAADVDDDGASNITDPIYLLNFLFTGGPAPAAPGGDCGPDPTPDGLACAEFTPCAPVLGPDDIPTARGNATVIPIEHATVALRWDGKMIYVDPDNEAEGIRDLPPPDLILVTDTHGDHLDGATIRAVAVEGTTVVMPAAVSTSLAGSGGIGKATPLVLANGATATVGDIGIEAVPMYNLTAGRLQYHEKGRGNGYVLDLAGTRVYFSGDTEDIPEMRALTGIDCAFLCMNLPFTMTPDQAASAALEFKPGVVYPYHYRGSDTNRFKSLVEAGSEEVEVRLREWYP